MDGIILFLLPIYSAFNRQATAGCRPAERRRMFLNVLFSRNPMIFSNNLSAKFGRVGVDV